MIKKRDKSGIIMAPIKPENVPEGAQWLAGQGSGSWYYLEKNHLSSFYKISRYSPDGIPEFENDYIVQNDNDFCDTCPYVFTYLSHHLECNILQHGGVYTFKRI